MKDYLDELEKEILENEELKKAGIFRELSSINSLCNTTSYGLIQCILLNQLNEKITISAVRAVENCISNGFCLENIPDFIELLVQRHRFGSDCKNVKILIEKVLGVIALITHLERWSNFFEIIMDNEKPMVYCFELFLGGLFDSKYFISIDKWHSIFTYIHDNRIQILEFFIEFSSITNINPIKPLIPFLDRNLIDQLGSDFLGKIPFVSYISLFFVSDLCHTDIRYLFNLLSFCSTEIEDIYMIYDVLESFLVVLFHEDSIEKLHKVLFELLSIDFMDNLDFWEMFIMYYQFIQYNDGCDLMNSICLKLMERLLMSVDHPNISVAYEYPIFDKCAIMNRDLEYRIIKVLYEMFPSNFISQIDEIIDMLSVVYSEDISNSIISVLVSTFIKGYKGYEKLMDLIIMKNIECPDDSLLEAALIHFGLKYFHYTEGKISHLYYVNEIAKKHINTDLSRLAVQYFYNISKIDNIHQTLSFVSFDDMFSYVNQINGYNQEILIFAIYKMCSQTSNDFEFPVLFNRIQNLINDGFIAHLSEIRVITILISYIIEHNNTILLIFQDTYELLCDFSMSILNSFDGQNNELNEKNMELFEILKIIMRIFSMSPIIEPRMMIVSDVIFQNFGLKRVPSELFVLLKNALMINGNQYIADIRKWVFDPLIKEKGNLNEIESIVLKNVCSIYAIISTNDMDSFYEYIDIFKELLLHENSDVVTSCIQSLKSVIKNSINYFVEPLIITVFDSYFKCEDYPMIEIYESLMKTLFRFSLNANETFESLKDKFSHSHPSFLLLDDTYNLYNIENLRWFLLNVFSIVNKEKIQKIESQIMFLCIRNYSNKPEHFIQD